MSQKKVLSKLQLAFFHWIFVALGRCPSYVNKKKKLLTWNKRQFAPSFGSCWRVSSQLRHCWTCSLCPGDPGEDLERVYNIYFFFILIIIIIVVTGDISQTISRLRIYIENKYLNKNKSKKQKKIHKK